MHNTQLIPSAAVCWWRYQEWHLSIHGCAPCAMKMIWQLFHAQVKAQNQVMQSMPWNTWSCPFTMHCIGCFSQFGFFHDAQCCQLLLLWVDAGHLSPEKPCGTKAWCRDLLLDPVQKYHLNWDCVAEIFFPPPNAQTSWGCSTGTWSWHLQTCFDPWRVYQTGNQVCW